VELVTLKTSSNLFTLVAFPIHPRMKLVRVRQSVLVVRHLAWMPSRESRCARENTSYLPNRSKAPAFIKEAISNFLSSFPLTICKNNGNSMTQSKVPTIYAHNCNRESGGYSDLCDKCNNNIPHKPKLGA